MGNGIGSYGLALADSPSNDTRPGEHPRVTDLKDLLVNAAARSPDSPAISGPEGSLAYAELDALANRIGRLLAHAGVGRGDRVGVWMNKSVAAVATLQGTLRLGAAYVPLDPLAPMARIEEIVADCDMAVVVTTLDRAQELASGLAGDTPTLHIDGLDSAVLAGVSDEPLSRTPRAADDLAYILYTSGSTGKPKGVCISHRNALAFIEWALAAVGAAADDRLSNHAPLHFDLSVLDLYVAFWAGASVHLVPDGMSYVPAQLVDFVRHHQITIWYSVPSALSLMMESGGLLDTADTSVHTILFAGEPFPISQLRLLYQHFPGVRYMNLYGPTETNVCTFYEVEEIAEDRALPVPIGMGCSGDEVWAEKLDGAVIGPGEEGELMVSGPTVFAGYWGEPPREKGPYPTGDIVRMLESGDYEYVGRRDHMVKVRGYRIELGDIEAALGQMVGMREVAVVVAGSGVDARLIAFIVHEESGRPTLLDVKRHCAERLPRYMIIDQMRFVSELPRTRNGKIDRARLTLDVAHMRGESLS